MFSVCAGVASVAVAVLAGLNGAFVVTAVWAALAIGFAARAGYGWRRLRPPPGQQGGASTPGTGFDGVSGRLRPSGTRRRRSEH